MEHWFLRIGVAAAAVIAGVMVTRARFSSRLRRRDDDRGDPAEVMATLPGGPGPRRDSAKVDEPE